MDKTVRSAYYKKVDWFKRHAMYEEALKELKKVDFCSLGAREGITYIQAHAHLIKLIDKNKFQGDNIDKDYLI